MSNKNEVSEVLLVKKKSIFLKTCNGKFCQELFVYNLGEKTKRCQS